MAIFLGMVSLPTLGQRGVFKIERVATGEVVATLDGVVVGFGPDAYGTSFEYGSTALSHAGVPEGGQTTPTGRDGKPRGRAVRVVSGGQLVTRIEAGSEVRYIELHDVLYCGSVTSKRVLYYLPVGFDAVIHRLVAGGRWETTFKYKGHPAMALPELITRDLQTGEIVYRAFDLTPVRTNVMEVQEEYYRGGKVISKLTTERGTGPGILIAIKSISAPIPRNYFAIDFVLDGWPFGSHY
jgi:hypothetical protein